MPNHPVNADPGDEVPSNAQGPILDASYFQYVVEGPFPYIPPGATYSSNKSAPSPAESHAVRALASALANFVPVLGTVKGVIEAVTGRDLVTGDQLTKVERLLGLMPPLIGAGGDYLRARAVLKAAASETAHLATRLAEEARELNVLRHAALLGKDGAVTSAATLRMLDKLDEVAETIDRVVDAALEGGLVWGIALKAIADVGGGLVDVNGLVQALLEQSEPNSDIRPASSDQRTSTEGNAYVPASDELDSYPTSDISTPVATGSNTYVPASDELDSYPTSDVSTSLGNGEGAVEEAEVER